MLNFGAKLRDLEKSLQTWKRRKLTLYGKINIVKTLGLSKLIFNASVLYITHHYIEQINKITFNFIWDGKPAKIKRKTLIGEKKKCRAKNVRFFYYGKSFENRLDQQSPLRGKLFQIISCDIMGTLLSCQIVTMTPKH